MVIERRFEFEITLALCRLLSVEPGIRISQELMRLLTKELRLGLAKHGPFGPSQAFFESHSYRRRLLEVI